VKKTVTAHVVHAARTIVRMRCERRCAGLSFGATPITVALEAAHGVHEVITQEQLDALLADTYLKHRKVELPKAPANVLRDLQAEAKAEKKSVKARKKPPAALDAAPAEEVDGDDAPLAV